LMCIPNNFKSSLSSEKNIGTAPPTIFKLLLYFV